MARQEVFVHLAYLDDSGTADKARPFQVMTAVIIHDRSLRSTEIFATSALQSHIPKEKAEQFWQKFEEFKAYELFKGYGPFEEIGQTHRFAIIDFLLNLINNYELVIVYGAVDKAKLRKRIYGSANPVDICFRICMKGIEDYVYAGPELALLIADESNKDRKVIRDSFYDYRQRLRPVSGTRLSSLHDDMYFGDSKYSIGIQLADLCAYFVAKHLEQSADTAAQAFYDKIRERIAYAQVEPSEEVVNSDGDANEEAGAAQ